MIMIRNWDKKSAENPFSGDDETRQIHRVVGYAFLLNMFLAIMKALLAFFSGSLAITASAIDSGTDAVASLLIYGGVKLSTKKTQSFPMGLYKLENLASVVIALFILIAGYEIIEQVFSPPGHLPRISLLYIVLLLAGTVATLLFGQYAIAVGRKTGSPALIAEGRHRQVDVLSSIVAVISVVLSYLDVSLNILGVTVDQIGAALILIFIARAGWELLSDGMRVLLDASIDFPTLDTIREIIKGEPLVGEIKSLMGRNAGRFRFIQATITVKTENLDRAHRVSEDIEMKIRDRLAHIEKVIIRYEPQKRSHDRIALPLEDVKGRISAHFGEAPYFVIVHIRRKDREIEKEEILANPYRSLETAKGIRVAEWLVKQGVEHVGVKEDVSHKGPGYVLSSGGVNVHLISADLMDSAINEIVTEGS